MLPHPLYKIYKNWVFTEKSKVKIEILKNPYIIFRDWENVKVNRERTENVELFLKATDNVDMTDQDAEDAEIAEHSGFAFKHDSLMEYSNMKLDFIKVFGKRIFVRVIGE